MSFQNTLENLRAKPEHVRKRIALLSSVGITSIIFLFWLASFSVTGPSTRSTITATLDRVHTPTQSLLAAVGNLFVDIKEIMFVPKKIIYSEIEVGPGER